MSRFQRGQGRDSWTQRITVKKATQGSGAAVYLTPDEGHVWIIYGAGFTTTGAAGAGEITIYAADTTKNLRTLAYDDSAQEIWMNNGAHSGYGIEGLPIDSRFVIKASHASSGSMVLSVWVEDIQMKELTD